MQTSTHRPPQQIERTFNVFVPLQHVAGAPPLPLVIDMHGAFRGAWHHNLIVSRMRDKGKTAGFVVLQPDSLPGWTASASEVKDRKVNDVDFIRDMLAKLDKLVCFDRNRIFASGLSSGGGMTVTLACASANNQLGPFKIAAIARVSSGDVGGDKGTPFCSALAKNPVPIRVIASNNDKLLAFLYGEDMDGLNTATRRSVETWARANGCTGEEMSTKTGQTGWGVLSETLVFGCANLNGRGDAILDLFGTGSTHRDGHVWPGGPNALPGEYATTDAIWDFFRAHPR